MSLAPFLEAPQYRLAQADKDQLLLPALKDLTAWHAERCPPWRQVVELTCPDYAAAAGLTGLPFLPVGVFKSHRLASIPDAEVFTTLTSSGTTGQQPSRIVLDRPAAAAQAKALASVMATVLGRGRLPMILADTRALLEDERRFSARAAGVLGMMTFGRDHFFALGPDMALDRSGLESFLARHGSQPFLIFGFTFMAWKYLYQQVRDAGIDLSHGILIHSGGWKKLIEEAVDNAVFKAAWRRDTGLARIHNFYGMVEQIGTVFLEGEDGLLYPPNFADVVIRDLESGGEASPGVPGLIQVFSVLPRSYPGHSLLTEDLGVLHHVDLPASCSRLGKGITVTGRVPRAEIRGCSDVHAAVNAG